MILNIDDIISLVFYDVKDRKCDTLILTPAELRIYQQVDEAYKKSLLSDGSDTSSCDESLYMSSEDPSDNETNDNNEDDEDIDSQDSQEMLNVE